MEAIEAEREKDLYKNAMRYRKYHSKLVADIALEVLFTNKKTFTELQNIEQAEKILYLASLLHDIKKFDERHNKAGAKWFEKNIDEYLYLEDNNKRYIRKLISSHKLGAKLKDCEKELLYLILIIRISDKLSKLKEKYSYSYIREEQINNTIYKVKEKTLENSIIDLREDIECFFSNIKIGLEMIN